MHVLVDGGEDWDAALTISHDKVRVSFAVPWEGMLLLGTTDTEHDGEPEDVRVTDEDVQQVLAEAAVAVDGLGPPRATFCGLRVLPGGDGRDGERTPRDGVLDRADRNGQRRGRQADDVPADRARRARPPRRARPRRRSRGRCPARPGSTASTGPSSSTRRRERICCTSTARSRPRCSRRRVDDPSLLEPLVAGRPDLRAQDVYARSHEWAVTDEDVLRRRTTGWLAGSALAGEAPVSTR